MLSQSFALIVALMLCLGYASAIEAVTPHVLPAVQTSVTSTAFNPALTNAGGTTNSAGTFNVASLSQSQSYSFNTVLPVTTSFVITSPNIAASADVSTPAYLTGGAASAAPASAASSAPSVSLATGVSVVALSSVSGGADAAMTLVPIQLSWTLLLSGAAAVVGAAIVL